jgi:hypothetical protein
MRARRRRACEHRRAVGSDVRVAHALARGGAATITRAAAPPPPGAVERPAAPLGEEHRVVRAPRPPPNSPPRQLAITAEARRQATRRTAPRL